MEGKEIGQPRHKFANVGVEVAPGVGAATARTVERSRVKEGRESGLAMVG